MEETVLLIKVVAAEAAVVVTLIIKTQPFIKVVLVVVQQDLEVDHKMFKVYVVQDQVVVVVLETKSKVVKVDIDVLPSQMEVFYMVVLQSLLNQIEVVEEEVDTTVEVQVVILVITLVVEVVHHILVTHR